MTRDEARAAAFNAYNAALSDARAFYDAAIATTRLVYDASKSSADNAYNEALIAAKIDYLVTTARIDDSEGKPK
jgi:hypothetical protein